MEKSNLVKALLIVAGIIGIGTGGSLLFVPVTFEASVGINLEGNSNLLSEIRAPGGTLLVAGILILSGAFIHKITCISIILSTLFYLSYGLSRLFSIIIDGVPGATLLIATVTELIIGFVSLFVLIKWMRHRTK